MHEAKYYSKEGHSIFCELCPQECHIMEEGSGNCGVRRERDGKLFALNYDHCGMLAVDPVERKPLFHFYPGWNVLSMGTIGCNMQCTFCQNWNLVSGEDEGKEQLNPETVLSMLREHPPGEVLGAAYCYNEPMVWYEFVLDSSRLLAEHGYKNILVTNGYINKAPLKELLPSLDALNIDIKAFSDEFYRRYSSGKGLQEIRRTVEDSLASCHVELTYLVIGSLNDSLTEINRFIDWVASLDSEIPVHFRRYFPAHRMDVPPTPIMTMRKIWDMARERLSYVYLGSIMDVERNSTYCPHCGKLLIKRRGYHAENVGLVGSGAKCQSCAEPVNLSGSFHGEEQSK